MLDDVVDNRALPQFILLLGGLQCFLYIASLVHARLISHVYPEAPYPGMYNLNIYYSVILGFLATL